MTSFFLTSGNLNISTVLPAATSNLSDLSLYGMIFRFFFNLTIAFIITVLIYYPIHKKKDSVFSNLIISSIAFLLSYPLHDVKFQIALALGLSAVVSVIKFRTDFLPVKELIYTYTIITLSVLNTISFYFIRYEAVLFSNLSIILILILTERLWLRKHESVKTIIYEKIELIKPEKREELTADLEKRTGIKINKIEIGRIDFLRDVARLRIYYFHEDNKINQADLEDYYNSEESED